MLEKELAQAALMAEKANAKVEQLRKKLLADSEKTHARLKRELGAARKRHKTATARMKSAKTAVRKKLTPDNQQKLDTLMKQAQEFAESLPKIAKAAYEAAERLVSVKTHVVMEDRKAKAANQAASLVAKAAAKPKKKPAAKKKSVVKKAKAAPSRKPAAKKKAAAVRKAPAKRKSAR